MFNLILGSFSLSFARINLFPVENSSDVGKDRYNDVFLYAVVLIFVKYSIKLNVYLPFEPKSLPGTNEAACILRVSVAYGVNTILMGFPLLLATINIRFFGC